MHQFPRSAAPRSPASAAAAAQTAPSPSHIQGDGSYSRAPFEHDLPVESSRSSPRPAQDLRQMADDEKSRINQIIQHFFSKSALIILSSRVPLTPALLRNGDVRIDRWFNTQLVDDDSLAHELREWRLADWFRKKPTTLVIEVYLDIAQLPRDQSLVAKDVEGRSWDVSEALQTGVAKPSKLVYERWSIHLDDGGAMAPSSANDTGPGIYKRGVVAMRTLFAHTKFMPAWRLGRRISRQTGNGAMLKPRYRIVDPSVVSQLDNDSLTHPLFPADDEPVVETFQFHPFDCCIGPIKTSVTYRRHCEFAVEPTERLLSTKAMRSSRESRGITVPVGSQYSRGDPSQPGEGSHNRRVSGFGAQGSVEGSGSRDQLPDRSVLAERLSLSKPSRLSSDIANARSAGNPLIPRRTSVSFQPFKAGSLSSSPSAGMYAASPSSSIGRSGSNISLSHLKNRSSVTTLPQQALRTPQPAVEAVVTSSASSSPKPAPMQRFSSSFSNRKSRFPSSGNIKGDDDNLSSGKASASSLHRGSSLLPEADASSASAHTDDDNIADFLKLLDRNKGLQSFSKTDQAVASQRTAAQYSKFVKMRDSTTQLTESMSSSLMLHRSSSSSSRHLQNVPGMIAGSSFSPSSSPGKAISPHTPHLPAVPSRLSNNSIAADYTRETSQSRPISSHAGDSRDGSRRARSPPGTHGTPASTAIDIPTSPRAYPAGRRSSSATQQGRVEESQTGLAYGLRAASVPNDQGGEMSMSESLLQTESGSGARRRRELHATVAVADDDDEPLLFALAE